MTSEPLLNPTTKRQLDSFMAAPSHALLLVGPRGSGKKFLAKNIAANLLDLTPEKLANYPYFLTVSKPEDKQNIPIESIRSAVHELRLKVADNKNVNRVVLILDAHEMTPEAQNALLKSLEEPPASTVFILSVPNEGALLPTIESRTTRIALRPVTLEDSLKFYIEHEEAEVQAAWNLSQGAAGLLNSLLSDDDHPLKSTVEAAKKFIGKDRYGRLLELDAYTKGELDTFLLALGKVIQALYKNAAKSGNARQTAKLTAAMRLILQSREDLSLNISLKLVTLRLALNLSL